MILCWHRLMIRGKHQVCRHCGVAVEECPCVSGYRSPKDGCRCCSGSGWVAIVRGQIEKFIEYVEARK